MEKDKETNQQKIETAVKFLRNPRVRQTPMKQRRAFLEKKGLTKEEIDQAIALSGTAADEHNIPPDSPSQSLALSGPPPPPPLPPAVPWKGYFVAAVIGGGLGYLVVNLVKTYILPLIIDMKEKDEKLEKLETTITQTNTNITEAIGTLQSSLQSVQDVLVEQHEAIRSLSSDLAVTQDKLAGLPSDSYSVGDLKAEIVSLKGLLLNRKQFAPAIIGSPQTGIPSWQRTTTPSAAAVSFAKDVKGGDDSIQQVNNQSKERDSQKDHSHINGHSSSFEVEETSPQNSSSSNETSSPNTVKSNISQNEQNMNDAIIADQGDVSNDSTLSSLSDMSASTSFNEASIAFSSTCIKIPPEAMSVNEPSGVPTQEVD